MHTADCRWERTTIAECEYRATHHYCPHPEHACTCAPALASAKRPEEDLLPESAMSDRTKSMLGLAAPTPSEDVTEDEVSNALIRWYQLGDSIPKERAGMRAVLTRFLVARCGTRRKDETAPAPSEMPTPEGQLHEFEVADAVRAYIARWHQAMDAARRALYAARRGREGA